MILGDLQVRTVGIKTVDNCFNNDKYICYKSHNIKIAKTKQRPKIK